MNAAPVDRRIERNCRRYEGRVAVVTGAAQGLGRVVARRLANEGASLVLGDLNGDKLAAAAEELRADTGADIVCSAGDLVTADAADALAATGREAFGRLDVLVNGAAALIRKPLLDFDEELLQLGVAANVWPALRCSRAVLPLMLAEGYGRIVNIGGEAWRGGTPFHTLLGGIGKGSLVGLTVTLAGEFAASGITVNCVSPGGYEIEHSPVDDLFPVRDNPDWTPPDVAEQLKQFGAPRGFGIPRRARAQEVASVVAFFAAEEASYITGQHVGVSGGRIMI